MDQNKTCPQQQIARSSNSTAFGINMTKVARTLLLALTSVAGLAVGCGEADKNTDSVSQTTSPLLSGGAFYDPAPGGRATTCLVGGTAMHCCPTGTAMIGANIGSNIFKCKAFSSSAGGNFPVLDLYTSRTFFAESTAVTMHACPFGSAMVGLNASLNRLACQASRTTIMQEFLDTSTSDGTMHVCGGPPGTYALGGIHIGANKFGCVGDLLAP